MARANRHYIPNGIWHITHRCHKREFLLKFAKDRQRWLHWLFEAKKRFGLCILNYIVTSNHIHLLAVDSDKDVIPKSIQLIAGRTAQEFNQRKRRKGAFWEDRYHATAIQTDEHLMRCLVYIDLNMVRAGVVSHSRQWPFSGYNEIQNPPQRYALIDRKTLVKMYSACDIEQLRRDHKSRVEETVKSAKAKREPIWSEAIAVGDKVFVEETKEKLGFKARGRKVVANEDRFMLRESQIPYNAVSGPQKSPLSPKNMYFWNERDGISIT